MQVKHLDHLNLSVADFEETADWYRRMFGFEVVERGIQDGEPWGVIRGGDAMLCIYQRPDWRIYDKDALGDAGQHRIAQAFPGLPVIRIDGGHDHNGEVVRALDLQALQQALETVGPSVDAFAALRLSAPRIPSAYQNMFSSNSGFRLKSTSLAET